MEKQKTALQELITEFDRLKESAKSITDMVYLDGVIAVIESRKEVEKKQLKDAYSSARNTALGGVSDATKRAEQWYNETYGNNE